MRSLPIFMALLLLMATVGCREEKLATVEGRDDPEMTPTMLTRDVETMISDSGVMRYRATTPLWLMYEEAAQPRWTFPEGLKLVTYDDFMRPVSTVTCDSATFLEDPKIWRLDGNVDISNAKGEKFLTNQLYWDQRNRKVYSDSFIHIEQIDRTLEGHGFISNERLTAYSIKQVSGIFPVDALRRPASPRDSIGRE